MWSFPPGGNGLYRPLDSSAFVPDTALPPRPGGHPSRGGELEPPRRLVPDLPAAGRRRSTTARLSSPNALHPCRRASMQASFRWNDDGGIPACARLQQAGRNDGAGGCPFSLGGYGWPQGRAAERWGGGRHGFGHRLNKGHRGACLPRAGGQSKKNGTRRSGPRSVNAGRPPAPPARFGCRRTRCHTAFCHER